MLPLRNKITPAETPLSDAEIAPWRVYTMVGIFLLAGFVLLARLWYLQVYLGDEFRAQALRNRSSSSRLNAPRGLIEDYDGKALVTNNAQFMVYINFADMPKKPIERDAILDRLAPLLEIDRDELDLRIKKNRLRPADPIPVAEAASQHIVARVAENQVRLPGVRVDVVPTRKYEQGRLASHLLGYIGKISEKELADSKDSQVTANDYIGKEGVERTYNTMLNGIPGGMRYEVDARGRRQRIAGIDSPQPGATLRLGLDRAVQQEAENQIGGWQGAIVALDPRTGRIIAMASGPTYDANRLVTKPVSQAVYTELYDRKTKPYQNRAIGTASAPGSTFKVITTAAGLATGTVGLGTYAECRGGMYIGRQNRGNWKKCHGTHGSIGLIGAMAASCDVFYYQAGIRIKPSHLADWATKFGLGEKTGIDLPLELSGLVPSPEWRMALHRNNHKIDGGWYDGETANVAIGQGSLKTTPLQMALVAAAIANKGIINRPYVVQNAAAADGKTVYTAQPTVLHKLPLNTSQLHIIDEAMRAVITRGTSQSAQIPGIYVAGKSGSQEIKRGGLTNAWFIAYAAKDGQKPSIAVSVFIEATNKGLHGGETAAPLARKVIEAYFASEKRRAAQQNATPKNKPNHATVKEL